MDLGGCLRRWWLRRFNRVYADIATKEKLDWPLMTLILQIYTDLLSATIRDVLCFRLRRG
jgi:hypothetical protein